MQSTLRTRIAAAAMLLVPLGALIAAQPAAAQQQHDADRGHGQSVRFDKRAPTIFDLTPSQSDRVDERGQTRVSARFSDEGSGVDARSVVLRVDNRNVTGRARIDGNDVKYADNLRPGRHVAEVQVRDRAGNIARRTWSFIVVDRDHRVGSGYGR